VRANACYCEKHVVEGCRPSTAALNYKGQDLKAWMPNCCLGEWKKRDSAIQGK
jgi:hypothetical protein